MSDIQLGTPTLTGPTTTITTTTTITGDAGLIIGAPVIIQSGAPGKDGRDGKDVDPAVLNALTTRLTAVEASDAALAARVATLEGANPDISSYYTAAQVDNLLGTKANASTVGNLTARVNRLEDHADALDAPDLTLLFENALA